MTTRGAIYVATGAAHVAVAVRSAATLKRHNPDLPVTLFCDHDPGAAEVDDVQLIEDGHRRSKLDWIGQSPYDQTLFLDNDTVVRADLSDAFDLLDRFDLCATHVYLWDRPRHRRVWKQAPPDAFAEINTGVIFFRRTPRVMQFLSDWQAAFRDAAKTTDQFTFRELLWASDLRFYILPQQYNKRIFEASEYIYSDQPKPRILHLKILTPQTNPIKRWWANRIARK